MQPMFAPGISHEPQIDFAASQTASCNPVTRPPKIIFSAFTNYFKFTTFQTNFFSKLNLTIFIIFNVLIC